MDPILVAALRKLREASARAQHDGVTFDDHEMESFLREETGGKYGLQDADKMLASVDTHPGLRNLARSVAQGATLGFADELAGLGAAVVPGGKGYTEARDESRLRDELFKSAHPKAALGAEVAGGIGSALIPVGGIARVGTFGGRVARGIGLGAAFGAASGAGHAEHLRDVPGEALKGGAGGAAVGGALEGAVAPVVGAVGRAVSPKLAAAGRIARAVEASGGVEEVDATRRAVDAAGRGHEATLGDLTGPLRGEAEYVATNSPKGRAALEQIVEKRQAGASDRVLQDVRNGVGDLGDTPVAARLKALQADRQAWAKEAYGALSDTPVENVRPFLMQAMQDPAVQKALARAQETGLVGPTPTKGALTFQHLHDVVQALDDQAKAAFRTPGQGNLGRRLSDARKELVANIEAQFPAFRPVSQEYAHRLGLEKALVDGDKLAAKLFDTTGAVDTRGLAERVRALPAAQLAELRRGMASRLVSTIRAAQTNHSLAARITKAGDAMQDRLEVLFGDHQTFQRFMDAAEQEANLAELGGVIHGSQTARRLGQHPEASVLRNIANLRVGDAIHGLVVKPQAVADALAQHVTVQGSGAVQQLLQKMGQQSARVGAVRTFGDAAGGHWLGGLLGELVTPPLRQGLLADQQ